MVIRPMAQGIKLVDWEGGQSDGGRVDGEKGWKLRERPGGFSGRGKGEAA